MRKKFKIGLITVNRSDFGIQKELIKKLTNHKKIDLHLIVTGSHFQKKYGNTIKEIKNEKIRIRHSYKIDFESDNNVAVNKYICKYINFFGNIFKKKNFDNIIILGDRYEMLAAAVSCRIFNINISHIHGGETTFGAQDEYFRHAISKLSNFHFVSLNQHKMRLVKMGENPNNIIISGAPSLENIKDINLINRNELEKYLKIKFRNFNFLLTFHPETLNPKNNIKDLNLILKTISKLKDCFFIITSPAPDINSLKMMRLFNKKIENIKFIKSLGRERYFSLLKISDGVIGNSSSGIIEAASFNKYVVNIGARQQGRFQSNNVLNCRCSKIELVNSIKKLQKLNKLNKNKKIKNIYFKKNSSKIILDSTLRFLENSKKNDFKKFYDFNIKK